MKRSILYALTAGLITAGMIIANPAKAEAPSPVNVSIVSTGDLNLASAEGQRQLDRRLFRAAAEVCGNASDADLKGKRQVRECREETLELARADRDSLMAEGSGRDVIAVTAAR